jgi:hypothetical protein
MSGLSRSEPQISVQKIRGDAGPWSRRLRNEPARSRLLTASSRSTGNRESTSLSVHVYNGGNPADVTSRGSWNTQAPVTPLATFETKKRGYIGCIPLEELLLHAREDDSMTLINDKGQAGFAPRTRRRLVHPK